MSFFRFETQDTEGTQNPLTTADDSGQLRPDPQKAYIYGSSQSGRFITHMIWQGFHVDAAGRLVFDGARIHVAGGGKGGFNHRFAQTTHHPSHLEG
ncbi:MAG: alpha/beta hydrolase domain-containing protein, partial [Planctomycetota bacterium]